MKSLDLRNKCVLVTGAAGHLGRAICGQLSSAGAHLVVTGRSMERLRALVAELRAMGAPATMLQADIAQESERQRMAEFISAEFGKLDGLVNNAYGGAVGTIETSTVEQIRASLEISITAPFNLVQLLLPALRNSGAASIVNMASMYGMVSPDGRIYGSSGYNSPPFYGAAKAGLIQMTRYLACHLAEHNIRVNAVSPGPFPPQSIKVNQPEFHGKLAGKVPMGRIGVADEIGGAVQFLLSEAASYITGINLPVDGGWTAGSN